MNYLFDALAGVLLVWSQIGGQYLIGGRQSYRDMIKLGVWLTPPAILVMILADYL